MNRSLFPNRLTDSRAYEVARAMLETASELRISYPERGADTLPSAAHACKELLFRRAI